MTGSVLQGRLVQRHLQKLHHNFHSGLLSSLHPLPAECRSVVALAAYWISGKFLSPVHLELRHAVDVMANLCMSEKQDDLGPRGQLVAARATSTSAMLCLRDVACRRVLAQLMSCRIC